jgi:hypothetical protein
MIPDFKGHHFVEDSTRRTAWASSLLSLLPLRFESVAQAGWLGILRHRAKRRISEDEHHAALQHVAHTSLQIIGVAAPAFALD